MLRASVATRSKVPAGRAWRHAEQRRGRQNGTRNVDFSASYKISKKFSVSLEAINLTNQANDLYTSSVRNSVVQNTVTGPRVAVARGWTSKRIFLRSSFRLLDRPRWAGTSVTCRPRLCPTSPTVGRALQVRHRRVSAPQELRCSPASSPPLCSASLPSRSPSCRAGRAHRHRHGQQWQLLFAG